MSLPCTSKACFLVVYETELLHLSERLCLFDWIDAQWQRGAVPAFKGVRAPLKKGRSNLKGPAKGGLTKPAKISKQLADFLGMDWNPETRLARTDVVGSRLSQLDFTVCIRRSIDGCVLSLASLQVKVLCDYVKKNNLQDPADGRKINWYAMSWS